MVNGSGAPGSCLTVMVYGKWFMFFGSWFTVHGSGFNGSLFMVHSSCFNYLCTVHGSPFTVQVLWFIFQFSVHAFCSFHGS